MLTRTFRRWDSTTHIIIINSGSLVGTAAVTSGFGFIFWWLAARLFSPSVVGIASATISAMMLLAEIGILGIGTLLIGEMSRQPAAAASLITTGILVAGTTSGILSILFIALMPHLSNEFVDWGQGVGVILLFALGVVVTSAGSIVDQSLIGLFRGGLQLQRNFVFAVVKLVILLPSGIWIVKGGGLTIYATWVAGNLISLLFVAGITIHPASQLLHAPQPGIIRKLGRSALEHHLLNVVLLIPRWVLPVLVTVLLSATANAAFFMAWMIVNFLFTLPYSLTTMLYAIGSSNPAILMDKLRFTLKTSFVIGIVAGIALLAGGPQILFLFGRSYAEQIGWSLPVLGIGVFPIIIRCHYIAICRVERKIAHAVKLMMTGAVLELMLATAGAYLYGLEGLCTAWVSAVFIEALFAAPSVYRSVRLDGKPSVEVR